MSDVWVDVSALKQSLKTFFNQQKRELNRFGNTVNQTFEAFVVAQVLAWYKDRNWSIDIVNPLDKKTRKPVFRLKFSTRGRPGNYSYARCTSPDGKQVLQVRHQLRVATRYHKDVPGPKANICLDVAVIQDTFIDHFNTHDDVPNAALISFGEAKHMSAFAELIASFVGIVHELQPERLKRVRLKKKPAPEHPSPFLYVSGNLWQTARGVVLTLGRRKYDVDVWSATEPLSHTLKLPTKP